MATIKYGGSPTGDILQIMSNSQACLKDLKDQECKEGYLNWPPVPYVLEVDEVQEMVQESQNQFYKIKLENKSEFSITIWDIGTNEQFLNHILSTWNDHSYAPVPNSACTMVIVKLVPDHMKLVFLVTQTSVLLGIKCGGLNHVYNGS